MPKRATVFTDFRRRLPAHPAQPGPGQAHTVLFTPRGQVFGRVAHGALNALQVIGMDALEHHCGVLAQQLQVDLVDIEQALTGIGETRVAISVEAILINAARHLGTELFQQPITHCQRLVHPTALGDIDANRQVTYP
ncbi:hypothetical protein D3C76_1552760 [compost metagenome]